MLIVLDTNVLVSGMLVAEHAPGRLLDLLRTGKARLAVDDRILAEYEDVLRRPYLRRYFTVEERQRVMAFIHSDALPILCTARIEDLPDPKDAAFIETALAAEVPLVTGNLKHFPAQSRRGVRVITPAQCLDDFHRHQA